MDRARPSKCTFTFCNHSLRRLHAAWIRGYVLKPPLSLYVHPLSFSPGIFLSDSYQVILPFFFSFLCFPLTSISPDFKRISTERLLVSLKIKGLSPKFGCKGESCWMLVPRDLGNWKPCDSWTVLLGFVISWPLDPFWPVHLSFTFLAVFQEGKEMLSPAEAAVGGPWVTGVLQRVTHACCAGPEAGSYR